MERFKSIKKTFAGVLLATFLFPTAMFAAGTGDDPTPTTYVPTAAESKALQEKNLLAEQHAYGLRTFAQGEMKTLNVANFKQETSYWCGPATVKQVVHFLNGSSQNQTFYAGKLGTTTDGTDFSKIPKVLNDYQTSNTYSYRSFDSNEFVTWQSVMILTTDWGYPAVLDLKITPQNMPYYKSNVAGHILNTSGYDARNTSDTSSYRVRVTDRLIREEEGKRSVTSGIQ